MNFITRFAGNARLGDTLNAEGDTPLAAKCKKIAKSKIFWICLESKFHILCLSL